MENNSPAPSKVARLPKGAAPTVGVDDGYAYIKLAWMEGATIKMAAIPSRAEAGVSVSAANGVPVGGYQADEDRYTVNAVLSGADTRFSSYPTSTLNRALVQHALIEAGFGGRQLRIGTTLPPGNFFRRSGVNDKLIEAKRANLLAPIQSLSGAPVAEIIEHEIFPEATAAVTDYLLGDDGRQVREFERPIAVVDIGGRTTDVVVILPTQDIDRGRLKTEDMGVLNVIDIIREGVIDEFDIDSADAEGIDFEKALRTGTLSMHGQAHDIAALRAEAINEVAKRILQMVNTQVGGGAALDAMLFVGGGAELMKDVIAGYRNAVVHPFPQYANARGVLKALTWG